MFFPCLFYLLNVLVSEEPSAGFVVPPDYRKKLAFVFRKGLSAYPNHAACFQERVKVFGLVVMIMPLPFQIFASLVP